MTDAEPISVVKGCLTPDAEVARLRQQPATDIQRACQTCGKQCYCIIQRTLKPGRYTMVEDTRAVCPECRDKEQE